MHSTIQFYLIDSKLYLFVKSNIKIIPLVLLKKLITKLLYHSYPAVSHIYNYTNSSSIYKFLILKSMVVISFFKFVLFPSSWSLNDSLEEFYKELFAVYYVYILKMDVFPTFISPINSILNL